MVEERSREQLELLRGFARGLEALRFGEEGFELDRAERAQRIHAACAVREDALERVLENGVCEADLVHVLVADLSFVHLAKRSADGKDLTGETRHARRRSARRIVLLHGIERLPVEVGERNVLGRGRTRHDEQHRQHGSGQRDEGQPARAVRAGQRDRPGTCACRCGASLGERANDALR